MPDPNNIFQAAITTMIAPATNATPINKCSSGHTIASKIRSAITTNAIFIATNLRTERDYVPRGPAPCFVAGDIHRRSRTRATSRPGPLSGILKLGPPARGRCLHPGEYPRPALPFYKEPPPLMAVITGVSSGLERFGIGPVRSATRNLTAAALFEEAIRRREGAAAIRGPLVVRTGKHTGRSPQDKFFVREAGSERNVDWGKTNKPFEQAKFDALLDRVADYLHEKDVYVLDAFAGADPKFRLPIRVLTEYAWHNLFARHLFIPAKGAQLDAFAPEFAVDDPANFLAVPDRDGTRSDTFIIVDLGRKLIL